MFECFEKKKKRKRKKEREVERTCLKVFNPKYFNVTLFFPFPPLTPSFSLLKKLTLSIRSPSLLYALSLSTEWRPSSSFSEILHLIVNSRSLSPSRSEINANPISLYPPSQSNWSESLRRSDSVGAPDNWGVKRCILGGVFCVVWSWFEREEIELWMVIRGALVSGSNRYQSALRSQSGELDWSFSSTCGVVW